jgi:phage terminase large subunit
MAGAFQLPAYGWRPRADQLEPWNGLIRPDLRYGNICAHRRWGKDELLLQLLAIKAMQRVGAYWHCLPEYGQVRRALWEGVNPRTKRVRVDDAFPSEIVAKRDNDTMMLWLESGSTVQFVGSDRFDSLVGAGLVGLTVSEAALTKPEFTAYTQPMIEEANGWRVDISTPRGKNHFYHAHIGAMEDIAKGQKGVVAAYLPASRTPVFSPAQLQRIQLELARMNGVAAGLALYQQEYEVNWDAAVVGAVWGAELTRMASEGRVGNYPFDKRFAVFTSWDIGIGDSTVILFWQHIGSQYRLIHAVEASDIGLDSYIEELRRLNAERGFRYAAHYGPHDIKAREWLRGVSRMDEARRLGLEFKHTPQTRVSTQVACGAQLIGQMVADSGEPSVAAALEHMKAWRYPRNKHTGALVMTPLHDEHSHTCSALCTMAVNVAASLGMASRVAQDSALHGADEALSGITKFDPRQFGPAPYSRGGAWAPPGAGAPETRGAFG